MVTLVSTGAVIILGFSSAFSPSFNVYVAFQFLLGLPITGNIVYPFIFISEYVGPKWRSRAGMAVWVAASISINVLGVTAIFVRKWKNLTIACTAPYIIFLFFFK